jgi:DNA-binding phage protein
VRDARRALAAAAYPDRSFSGTGNPTLKTTIAVMKALGIELTAKTHT